VEESLGFGVVGIADDKVTMRRAPDFLGARAGPRVLCAVVKQTGYEEDERCGIVQGSVNFANGVAGLRISSGGDSVAG